MTLATALTLVAATVLVTTIVTWSAERSDEIAGNRQLQIVAGAINRRTAQVPHDQESVAIWDDSVINVRNAFDENWIDVNLGVWMSTYFKHDRSYVLNADNRVVYGMADGKKTDVKNERLAEEIMAMIRDLRRRIASGALDAYDKGQTPLPRSVDRLFVEGHPAIVSVMPLVPHSSKVSQARGTEFLIVSLRFLDTSFPADLAANFGLDAARFSRTDDVKPTELSYTVTTNAHLPIGKFIWSPALPGRSILHDVIPILAAGLAAIAFALIVVLWRLRNAFQELMASEARSRHLAYHDALTGLPNRAFFTEELKAALNDVRDREGSLAILFLDLDRFKQVNDTLGHAVGDNLICHLAKSFSGSLSPGDLIARMGGDEFAILKQVSSTPGELNATCESLLQVALESFDALGRKAMIGLSIGVAIAPDDGIDQSELLRKADIALYQAKVKGGQRYQLFTEDMGKRLFARQEMEAELRCALQKGDELEVFYQPIYAAKDLEIYGVEALVRWNHPRLGLVSPLDFIGIAEESGLIDRLGEWVLQEACRAARHWNIETLSVNVSPLQLAQPKFAESVLDILLENGLSPHKLELEITETALLDSSSVGGKKALRSLREAGVRIALDDFGTGYSSLNYLIALEVDRVKIDRSFVDAKSSRSIIWAIINMAHALGLTVTAEGIETEDQRDFLVAIGSNHLQGYYLSKPLTEQKTAELIEAGARSLSDASMLNLARG